MADVDRIIINRLFDEVTTLLGDQLLEEHEFDVWMALLPVGFDGTLGEEPLPELQLILPPPRVVDTSVDSIVEKRAGSIADARVGVEIARVQKFDVSGITRLAYTDDTLRPRYWVVVPRGQLVTPELARTRKVPRFRQLATPSLFEEQWKLSLVEDR